MSAFDKIADFADAREPDHVVVRDGFTYGDCRALRTLINENPLVAEQQERIEALERQLGILHESDGRVAYLGVTAERVAELRALAKAEGPDREALREAILFYDLVRKAWEGSRDEYSEIDAQRAQVQLDLNTANAKLKRLQTKLDEATLLLERAIKPQDRPHLVREALEKLRG